MIFLNIPLLWKKKIIIVKKAQNFLGVAAKEFNEPIRVYEAQLIESGLRSVLTWI